MGSHPWVSGLLELLVNGLVGGHDHEDLDHHVEDGHGDQVRDIVPTQQGGITIIVFHVAHKQK